MPAVSQFCYILDALAHKDPSMRILEVGAGTGAMTRQIMKTLTSKSSFDGKEKTASPRYQQYDYTDVSPFFFNAAQEVYSNQGERMKFRKLDIETDPAQQGFECGVYDLVVAAAVRSDPALMNYFRNIMFLLLTWRRQVLHATSDLANSLKNCRKLLKP